MKMTTYLDGFADAHMHSNDVDDLGGYPDMDRAAVLLSCTARYDQWRKVEDNARKDGRIFPFYGIHPWYVDDVPEDIIDRLSAFIKEHPRCGVGEIGLDKYHGDYGRQLSMLEAQLSIASEERRPAAIHMVKEAEDILKAIRRFTGGGPIILHSFAGPDSYIDAFVRQNCFFSISPRILSKQENKIKQLIDGIPAERLLIETDAPIRDRHCPTMSMFIQTLSRIICVKPAELITTTKDNIQNVIN